MIVINEVIQRKERTGRTDEQIESMQKAEKCEEEAGEKQPGLLIIEPECNNPYCQICFGIDGRG